MKYDFSKKLTIGASRTLYSLQQAMLTLLSRMSFEDIAVGELCELAMLPRATFYNYFDDKYDLLEYCLTTIHEQLVGKGQEVGNCRKRMDDLMDHCFDYLDRHVQTVQSILKNNAPNQYFINQIRFYLLSQMAAAFIESADSHRFQVPQEMAARLYSKAVLILLEWKYLERKECSKTQAKEYLQRMIAGIDAGSAEGVS